VHYENCDRLIGVLTVPRHNVCFGGLEAEALLVREYSEELEQDFGVVYQDGFESHRVK